MCLARSAPETVCNGTGASDGQRLKPSNQFKIVSRDTDEQEWKYWSGRTQSDKIQYADVFTVK